MNTITELLLKSDAGKSVLPEKEFEVTRLSKKIGAPAIFKLRAISRNKYEEITGAMSVSPEGSISINNDIATKIALAGIIEPDLKDHDLMAHHKALTPEDLLYELLLVGEVMTVSQEVQTLSGFNNKDSVKEIKN